MKTHLKLGLTMLVLSGLLAGCGTVHALKEVETGKIVN
jgi:hypothetical protein